MPLRNSPEADNDATLSRRAFLGASMLVGSFLVVDLEALAKLPLLHTRSAPYAKGRLVGILPFTGEYTFAKGELLASGLDGRLFTDLSTLSPESLIIPASKFYVRTSCPDLIDYSIPWTIKLTESNGNTRVIPIEKIEAMSRDMGVHLMECSGIESAGQFGLMSACRWTGVPVTKLLKSLKLHPGSERICISGFDRHSQPSTATYGFQSVPGASWIFTLEQLKASGAFLATKMNGEPLLKDHGYPVRLFVPGWYGCTCIKWVDEISFVSEYAESTSQMKEFAGRTHQNGIPQLAREYAAASIDQAAMPIRVEQWEVDGRIRYNVVGIMWGGYRLTHDLQIRFLPDETYLPVETYHQTTNATWTLWSQKWTPAATGSYRIQLKVDDPSIPTRRLDKGYYTRAVEINEV